jgi:hypothetical protein
MLGATELERAPDGGLIYAWKAATAPMRAGELAAAGVGKE